MPKYYVRSDELERIVVADTPLNAAKKALILANGEQIGHFFCIDERGFRGPRESAGVIGVLSDTAPEHKIPTEAIIGKYDA